jgi:hypothetical protein
MGARALSNVAAARILSFIIHRLKILNIKSKIAFIEASGNKYQLFAAHKSGNERLITF